jgi:hypothetical protein
MWCGCACVGGVRFANVSVNAPYKIGLQGYGPNINLMRDPRFGRNCEVSAAAQLRGVVVVWCRVVGGSQAGGGVYSSVRNFELVVCTV